MKPDDPLLKILACPLDKGPLHLLEKRTGGEDGGPDGADGPEGVLYNPRLRRRYPIVDGIPQLLPSSGEQVTDEEHEELLRRIPGDGGPGGSRLRPGEPGPREPELREAEPREAGSQTPESQEPGAMAP